MSRNWINRQLKLAPPGATEKDVAANVARRREKQAQAMRDSRERARSAGAHVSTAEDTEHHVMTAVKDAGNRIFPASEDHAVDASGGELFDDEPIDDDRRTFWDLCAAWDDATPTARSWFFQRIRGHRVA
jgi:hypothetical protein